MGYHGGALAPLFDPDLSAAAAHDMAVTGTVHLYEWIVEGTPVYEEFGGGGGRWISVNRERGREPGTAKRSWYLDHEGVRTHQHGADKAYEGKVLSDDPIMPFIENDTRPHIIRPKNAKALRFRLWPTGAVVYAKMVRHPGTTGAHMVAKAEARSRAEFAHICRPRAERWAVEAARHAMRENREHPVHVGNALIGDA